MNIWFISDTHFNHANIIKYCNRPFSSKDEMNEILIENWNKCVKVGDLVYHLGDFGFGNISDIRKRLNGILKITTGDHDKGIQHSYLKPTDTLVYKQMLEYKEGDIRIEMFHWCMRVWPKSHYNSWHLFGHSHGCLKPIGKSMDVGVDANGFYPVALETIKGIMSRKEDNFNYIYKEKKDDIKG